MADLSAPQARLELEEAEPGHLRVRMIGEYDLPSIEVLEPMLRELLSRDAEFLTIEMDELAFMDTSGIALLLRIANRFDDFEIVGASPIIIRCIESLGLAERLRLRSRVERSFPPSSASVRDARRFVSDSLAGLPEELRARASLLTSELCTNALLHVGSGFAVAVARNPAVLRIEVVDRGEEQPQILHPTASDVHGRGLQIVASFADRWGVNGLDGQPGKTVWLELDVDRDAKQLTPSGGR